MKLTNTDPALLRALDRILSDQPEGVREIDLMNALDSQYPALFPRPDLSDRLLLYQHHFMLRHHLYRLQQELAEKGQWLLDISLLTIVKRPASGRAAQALAEHDPVREYYLELENLASETAQSVENLMRNFWTSLAHYQQAPEAQSVLGLDGTESRSDIRKRVRQLSQKHHPDKGGDPEKFRQIQQAWTRLKH